MLTTTTKRPPPTVFLSLCRDYVLYVFFRVQGGVHRANTQTGNPGYPVSCVSSCCVQQPVCSTHLLYWALGTVSFCVSFLVSIPTVVSILIFLVVFCRRECIFTLVGDKGGQAKEKNKSAKNGLEEFQRLGGAYFLMSVTEK
jgi:hypothetical protein